MSSEVVIGAHGLGKVYRLYGRPEDRLKELVFRRRSLGRDFWALQDIDLEIERGETLGIIGRNGSGKSTLLQLVCGTLQPSTGDLTVMGRVAALLELGAGFNPDFTGRENVYLSATVLGLTAAEIALRFPAIEAFAGIGTFIDQPVRQYSSGMYARLAFAVCAHVDADILVVDEILAVGDAGFQQRCMRFLHAFRQRGTLLFVSHDEAAVMSLCDRAIWLDRGVLRANGPGKEVCRLYRSFIARRDDNSGVFRMNRDDIDLAAAARGSGQAVKAFDFDLDSAWARTDMPMIERAALLTAEGQPAVLVDGGSDVTLRIEIRAARRLERPNVAFVLRNRLGQGIFGDSTAQMAQQVPAIIEQGWRFTATFRFRLPLLPSGDYAIEPRLLEHDVGQPVDRLLDSLFVRINSDPVLEGLANVPLLRTVLVIGDGASARRLGTASDPIPPLADDPRWRGRNPMDILPFAAEAPWHGHGGARIEDAGFVRPDGSPATRIFGGDDIVLRIRARAERPLDAPILGFMLRNALGQNVFGENTFAATRNADRRAAAGETVTAELRFQMPYLPAGQYALAPSIIDGTQQDHIHLHWLEEAVTIRVGESPVGRSVIGVPMLEIGFKLEPSDAENRAA
ncbi:MAG TPA: ABC transporter ATP-binding protein [Stellaceae bacterium]|jgi:lipopolysaccharide transport system ATP-binding protein|nr:ABC transporter ATP-binding protein [Stellaceae bacterium]